MKSNKLSSYANDEQDILNGLKSYVLLRYKQEGLRTLSITSSSRGESKTWVAINLAMEFSKVGVKTLLIDLDLESPGVDVKLDLKNKEGITDVAGKIVSLKDAVIHFEDNLDLLLSGSKIKYIDKFLSSNVLSNTIANILKQYDMLIINNSPITSVEDCLGIANYANSMILCVGENGGVISNLRHVKECIDESGISLLGIIMTNIVVPEEENAETELKNVIFDEEVVEENKEETTTPIQTKKTVKAKKDKKPTKTKVSSKTKAKPKKEVKTQKSKKQTNKASKTKNEDVLKQKERIKEALAKQKKK